MRALMVDRLRALYPGARIIHELPTRYSGQRIDLAAVTKDQIITVEIKSSRDTMSRLWPQLLAFAPISTRLMVALAPRWNVAMPPRRVEQRNGSVGFHAEYTEAQSLIRSLAMPHVQTWTCCAKTGALEFTSGSRHSTNTHPWVGRALDLLHNVELRSIAAQHRIACDARTNHKNLVASCLDHLTGTEAWRAVCGALRARAAFAVESDPPVTAQEAPHG